MNEEAYVRAFRLAIVASALIHAREKRPEAVAWLEGQAVVAKQRLQEVDG